MSTKISWATDTWSPIIGCTKTSAGCVNCYAERMAYRLACMGKKHYPDVVRYLPTDETRWNGKTVFVESALTKPLHWRKPRKIFVVSMGDLFHKSVDFEWICEVLVIAALCPQHEFKILTKRSDIMLRFFTQDDLWSSQLPRTLRFYTNKMKVPTPYWLLKKQIPNVHLGVTVENQDNVGRIADLIRTPAAKTFISFEPLLEGVSCRWLLYAHKATGETYRQYLERTGSYSQYEELKQIDYAFIGCESGPGARLCSLDDIRHLMHQCRDAGVKIHVKQIPQNGKCNKNYDEWPPEFQVREV